MRIWNGWIGARACASVWMFALGGCFAKTPDPPPPSCPSPCPAATPVCVGTSCVECASNADCGVEVCSAGSCVACSEIHPCDDGLRCVGGMCSICDEDSDCEAGQTCQHGFCGAVCTVAADCPVDAAWFVSEAVEPASYFGCRFHLEGPFLSFCDGSGLHLRGESGTVCDPCLASLGGCGAGQACDGGNCTCSSNEDCPSPLVCRDGVCGTCAADDDCPCGHVCELGACVAGCTTDADCPGGRCDVASGRCPDCLSDDDCAAPARCYEDGCVVSCDIERDCFLGSECRDSGRCAACDVPLGAPSLPPLRACR
jgi:hypothetical protein